MILRAFAEVLPQAHSDRPHLDPLRVDRDVVGVIPSAPPWLRRCRGRFVLFTVTALLAGCSQPVSAGSLGKSGASRKAWGEAVSASAGWHLENRPRLQRSDCSGLVESILARAGASIRGTSRTFWTDARRNARLSLRPRPGDLVFFDRTYDANRNGRVDDLLTHVAVIARVDDDGTVLMVHRGGIGIRRLRMNLSHPSAHRRGGKIINDFLRARGYGGKRSPRLAGQLFRAVARPPGPEQIGRIKRRRRIMR